MIQRPTWLVQWGGIAVPANLLTAVDGVRGALLPSAFVAIPLRDKLVFSAVGFLVLGVGALIGRFRGRAKSGLRGPAEYTHFVINPEGKIQSGWEFASDARDDQREWGRGFRVVTRSALRRLGVNPKNERDWQIG
jgi:hypothetical protein